MNDIKKNVIKELQKNIKKSNGSIEEMQCIFYEIAKELMNNYVLKIGDDIEIELKEVEFYFFDCEKHPDIYTHLDKLQQITSGFLYVHKKGNTYGGMDITFGNENYFGGILIRGAVIKHHFENKYISGPNKFKEYLIKALNLDLDKGNSDELQKYFHKIKENIFLKKINNGNKNLILHGRRYNLNIKKEPYYANSLYRFVDKNYLIASSNEFVAGNKNIPESTLIKAISYMSNLIENSNLKELKITNEIQTYIKNIKNNIEKYIYINDYINKFKDYIRNKGTK